MDKDSRNKEANRIYKLKTALHLGQPIDNIDKDLLHIDIQQKELEGAIDAGAHLIGVVADFGGGKTSLVNILKKSRGVFFPKYKMCNICLWSFYGDNVKDDMEIITNMTHSFLYQLAKGMVSSRCARHVNRMLSKNYGMFELGINLRSKLILKIIVICIGYVAALFILAGLPEIWKYLVEIKPDILVIKEFAVQLKEMSAYILEKKIYVLAGITAIVLGREGITFSTKDSLGQRKPCIVDAYEVFDYIIEEKKILFGKIWGFKKYIICIEDLDRVESTEDIYRFLREIYKYSSMLTEAEKKRIIFLVETSPKLYEDIEAANSKKGQESRKIYAKIFDYILELPPIDQKQREKIVSRLIEELGWKEVTGSGDNNSNVEAIKWLSKGKSLDMRSVKLRLNKALSIQKTLEEESAEFEKSALTAYLEDCYMIEMNALLCDQEKFNTFMSMVKEKKKERGDEKEELEKELKSKMLEQFYCKKAQSNGSVRSKRRGKVERKIDLSSFFVEEWVHILCESSITDDYEKYFFRKVKKDRI